MSGLHLHRSNRLEALVALLAAHLRSVDPDPVVPVEIVVGSGGMERHLRHALSEHLGICANLRFPFPTAALDDAVAQLAGVEEPARDPWSPDVLVWAVLEVLPAVLADPRAEPLRRYVEAGELASTGVDARTFGLARRLADLFDRYVTYRPELAQDWSAGAPVDLPADVAWQPVLWRAVHERLGGTPHRAARIAAALRAPVDHPTGLPPLRIFGLSNLPGSWIEAVARVARHRDVDLYLLGPSDQYWTDLGRRMAHLPDLRATRRDEVAAHLRTGAPDDPLAEAGHPLLLSWGRVARDAQILLQSLPDDLHDRGADLFLDPLHGTSPDAPPTTLQRLQDDLLHAVHPTLREGFAARRPPQDDRSVQVHVCHGPTRQVEVLRDVLLGLLDDDPTLQPRDILVVTPDIEAYAPLVGAVFGQGERAPGPGGWERSGVPRLPFTVADLALRRLNPVADALLRVLAMVDGRAPASEVLDLLAIEPVGARFGIDADDLARVRTWVVDSGVRWGLDEADRARHDQPRDAQNTWRFGLERLLLGVVMRDDGRLVDGVRPHDPIEGADTALLGRFVAFCTTLFHQLEALRSPRAVGAWASALDGALTALTRTPAAVAWLTRRVRETLRELAEAAEVADSARPLEVAAVRAALEGRFEVGASLAHGAGAGVTFAGMVPERAVPYRVVALLGMDEGAFPRGAARAAFDLTLRHPRLGDRDPRDEDRYLMLEAVLSARQHLLVLYTGRDLRTNERRPPAVPVAELLDAIDVTWPHAPGEPRPSQRVTVEHTLQAFDPRNLLPVQGGAPRAFDRRLLGPAQASLGARRPAPAFLDPALPAGPVALAHDDLPLSALQRFWSHPVRVFLQQRLRLWLPTPGVDDIPDREPIELGWIDHAELLREVLAARGAGGDPVALRPALRASGALPLGRPGELAFDAVLRLADAMEACADQSCGWTGAAGEVDLDLPVAGERLVGRVHGCTDGSLVVFAYGDERPRDLLEAWISLLAWRAQEPSAPSRAVVVFGRIGTDGLPGEPKPIGIEVADAFDHLSTLVALRREGLARPLRFYPRTSHAFASAALDGAGKADVPPEQLAPEALAAGDRDEPLRGVLADAAGVAWTKGWEGGEAGGDAADRYLHHAFRGQAPFVDDAGLPLADFADLALRVWGPVVDGRRTRSRMKGWRTA